MQDEKVQSLATEVVGLEIRVEELEAERDRYREALEQIAAHEFGDSGDWIIARGALNAGTE